MRRIAALLLALSAAALSAAALGASASGPLVGSAQATEQWGPCRALGCRLLGTHLQPNADFNDWRTEVHALRGGHRAQVTRLHLPGRPGDGLVVRVRFLPQGGSAGQDARWGAALASAAAGYPVGAAQLANCWEAQGTSAAPRLVVRRGFDDPAVWCVREGGVRGVLLTLAL